MGWLWKKCGDEWQKEREGVMEKWRKTLEGDHERDWRGRERKDSVEVREITGGNGKREEGKESERIGTHTHT